MELTEIISELENCTGKFPRLALEKAIEEKEAITPLLLETLEKWKNNLEELDELPDYFLHIYALFLLAQFKETRAYSLIIEFFSCSGTIAMDVTGDIVTENLGSILASVSDGNIEPIKKLIKNPQVNEFVRAAGFDCLMVLVNEGVIDREVVIEYFEELFINGFKVESDEEESFLLSDLVVRSLELYPEELKQHIDKAFASDKIDPFLVREEDVSDCLQIGKEATLNKLSQNSRYYFIKDTIAEMEWWSCFQESPQRFIPQPFKETKFNPFTQKHPNKSKKKRKMQKQSRRKNRSKKK